MDASFALAIAFTLSPVAEGSAYVDNPRDPGGPTKYGITIATLSHELRRQATPADVRNISLNMAARIYRAKYWNAIGADNLPTGVDLLAFDICVNMGCGRALQFLAETKGLTPHDRVMRLDALRLGFWKRLAIWASFHNGWTRRETACKAEALKLLARGSLT